MKCVAVASAVLCASLFHADGQASRGACDEACSDYTSRTAASLMQRQMETPAQRASHDLNMEEHVDIAYVVDASALNATLRSMLSLSAHSMAASLTAHLLVPPSDQEMAKSLVRCFQQQLSAAHTPDRVRKVAITPMWKWPLNTDPHWQPSLVGHDLTNYGRLWLQEYLPQVGHLVYLDSDTLIKGDIVGLAQQAPQMQHPLAACYELDHNRTFYESRCPSLRQYVADDKRFFNAGVLLLDLDRWRAENISASLATWAATPGATVDDQLMLNLEFQGRRGGFDVLPPGWNINKARYRESPGTMIVHYTGPEKPWLNAGRRASWLQANRHLWSPQGLVDAGGDCRSFEL